MIIMSIIAKVVTAVHIQGEPLARAGNAVIDTVNFCRFHNAVDREVSVHYVWAILPRQFENPGA
jgi:hypothetical protein